MDTRSIRTPSTEVRAEQERLARLEERLSHELMDDEERPELRDHVAALRRECDGLVVGDDDLQAPSLMTTIVAKARPPPCAEIFQTVRNRARREHDGANHHPAREPGGPPGDPLPLGESGR